MKNRLRIIQQLTAVCLSIFMMAAVGCDDDDDDENNAAVSYSISGNASGTQVVPAVTGNGAGTITGTYDPKSRKLTYTSTWSGLSGAPTTGGFYTGAAGASGMIVGSPWTFESTATESGSTTGTVTLTEDQADALLAGEWYYTYGTTQWPAGEVRGQITATKAAGN